MVESPFASRLCIDRSPTGEFTRCVTRFSRAADNSLRIFIMKGNSKGQPTFCFFCFFNLWPTVWPDYRLFFFLPPVMFCVSSAFFS